MDFMEKVRVLTHIAKWRMTWGIRNTKYKSEVPENPKFMSPWDCVSLINDGDVVATSGLGGNQRASILYWAINEVYKATGRPKNLTFLSIGGQGGRGMVPGTVEEVGLEGLCTRFVAGHLETFKAQLKLADEGKLELQCVPQGLMALLFAAQANGEDSILTSTGAGTFLDPRIGRGTPVLDPKAEQLVTVEGDKLRFRLPPITISLFNAPAADREGNIYVKNAAMIGESYESSLAARKNGGKVIATVGLLVEKGYDKVFLPADAVDAIAYYPGTEQTGSVPHSKYWSFMATESKDSIDKAIERFRFVNQVLGITPRRTTVDNCLARLGASVFAENAGKSHYVNIGVGLPEEVCRLIYEGGLFKEIKLLIESGIIGGLPAPGVFFGGAVCPEQIISSPEMFKMCYEKLDVTVLGFLQVDSEGNVNVSNRGAGAINYVGPGGFIDLCMSAKMIVFVGTWMAHSKMKLEDGKLKIVRSGKPKFVDRVDEITFSGREGVKAGKKVFYVTNVGVFKLTERGVELVSVAPGIDIQKDILDVATTKILLPADGNIPPVDQTIMTGEGFKLKIKR